MKTMKFMKIYSFIILCHSTITLQMQETIQKKNTAESLQILEYISETDIWKNDINLRKIILNGKEINFNSYKINLNQQDNELEYNQNEYTTTKTEHEQIKNKLMKENETENTNIQDFKKLYRKKLSIVYEMSKVMYLALKCKYSDLIIDSLKVCLNIIVSCQKTYNNSHERGATCVQHTVKYFISKKKYFVKMIFNLFCFMERFTNLKYADQLLLKALASINLFLFHRKNYNTDNYLEHRYIEIEKETFVQMINFVERFRCKKCPITNHHYYSNDKEIKVDSDEVVINAFNPIFVRHQLYFDQIDVENFGNPNYDPEISEYYEDMYDTEHLILGFIFNNNNKYSDICNIQVKFDNMTDAMFLYKLFNYTKNSYDIKTIFNFQMLIISVIIDLSHMKFNYFNNTNNCKDDMCLVKLIQLVTTMKIFVGTYLPENYPRNTVNPLQQLYSLIYKDIESYSKKNDTILSDKTLSKINTNTVLECKLYTFIETLSVSDLILDISQHKHFKSFVRFFKVFLSESSTLKEYNFNSVHDERESFSGNICFAMSQFRENLFLFQVLLSSRIQKVFKYKPYNGTDFGILNAIDSMNESFEYLYQEYGNIDKIRNILVPISIYFKNVKYSNLNAQNGMLVQYSLLTANLLENFEINNCIAINYSFEMYPKISTDIKIFKFDQRNDIVDFNHTYIIELITRVVKSPREEYKRSPLKWISKFIPANFYKYYNSQFNSKSLNWDGTEDEMNSVIMSVTQEIIDYNYLIRLQLFKLKWFVYNLFKKMLYIAEHKNYYLLTSHNYFENDITLFTIQEDLRRLVNHSFPRHITTYLKFIFHAYNTSVFTVSDNPKVNEEINTKIQQTISNIKEQLEYLDITSIEDFASNSIDAPNKIPEYSKPPVSKIISIDRIHEELEEDYKFLSEILTPTVNSKSRLLLSKNDYFFIY